MCGRTCRSYGSALALPSACVQRGQGGTRLRVEFAIKPPPFNFTSLLGIADH
ncbi:hypothetical protein M408DRAFT_332292 [Serendipita vermifera MAFF 305830]|uniref:Uncharacterized protein n=1 Tax=Serendipita vermifera MAFF 305830 TaxID=933852 RepID=A0A0C3AU74_SERVB|nr:hypothetical protein M408DRAFT_332292 [Serendipita vermifera MAFF 305830]